MHHKNLGATEFATDIPALLAPQQDLPNRVLNPTLTSTSPLGWALTLTRPRTTPSSPKINSLGLPTTHSPSLGMSYAHPPTKTGRCTEPSGGPLLAPKPHPSCPHAPFIALPTATSKAATPRPIPSHHPMVLPQIALQIYTDGSECKQTVGPSTSKAAGQFSSIINPGGQGCTHMKSKLGSLRFTRPYKNPPPTAPYHRMQRLRLQHRHNRQHPRQTQAPVQAPGGNYEHLDAENARGQHHPDVYGRRD